MVAADPTAGRPVSRAADPTAGRQYRVLPSDWPFNWFSTTSSATTDAWAIWSWDSGTATVTSSIVNLAWQTWNASSTYVVSASDVSRAIGASIRRDRGDILEQGQKARKRAKKLLVENLNEKQRRTLEKHGWFEVKVGDRRFRIHNDRYQHNVFELDGAGAKLREFCAHTSHACPQEDHVLAQKLMLEGCPEEFFAIANQWDLSQGGRVLVHNSRLT